MPVPFVEVGDELNVELADVGDILIWPLIVLELQEFAHISIYRAVECNLGKTDGWYRLPPQPAVFSRFIFLVARK